MVRFDHNCCVKLRMIKCTGLSLTGGLLSLSNSLMIMEHGCKSCDN